MASRTTTDDDRIRELEAWLLEQRVGGARPVRIEANHEDDADGRPAWIIVITLPNPKTDSWPVDEVAALDRGIRDKALDIGLPWPWHVTLRPEHEEQAADDDVEGRPDE